MARSIDEAQALWVETMKRVSVIFTEHEESGVANASELVAILERINPEVIFLECPPAAFDDYLNGAHAELEATAVNRYRALHPVDLVPVDLPTPEGDFFAAFREVVERVARTGPEYDRIASCHRQYVAAHGFTYLNSAHCSNLFSKHHEAILTAIAKLADRKLADCYDTWIRTNKLRDTAMMMSIENYFRQSSFGRGAFLVGAGHRLSMVDLSGGGQVATSSTIQWDFGSFLMESDSHGGGITRSCMFDSWRCSLRALGKASASKRTDTLEQLFVARVSIDRRRQGTHMPRKPLRQEQILASPVDVRNGGVPQRMEWIEPVESCLYLPGPEGELDAALADAHPRLGAEQGIPRSKPLSTSHLMGPELLQVPY